VLSQTLRLLSLLLRYDAYNSLVVCPGLLTLSLMKSSDVPNDAQPVRFLYHFEFSQV
jgi:hypothetical protein